MVVDYGVISYCCSLLNVTIGNFRPQRYISKFDKVNYTSNTLKFWVVVFYMFCDLDCFMLINYKVYICLYLCSPVIVCMYHMGLWSSGCKINKLVKTKLNLSCTHTRSEHNKEDDDLQILISPFITATKIAVIYRVIF